MTADILFIHPPVAKPCEPPAGIARLCGALTGSGAGYAVLEASLEGLLYLAGQANVINSGKKDTWTERALRSVDRNLSSLRDPSLYRNFDRYSRAVSDVSRALAVAAPEGITLGLADYQHNSLSPLKSSDLLRAAETPEENPFYPYFCARLRGLMNNRSFTHIGISLNYLSQALCAFAIAGFMKKEFPELKIVFGGGLVTSWIKGPVWKAPFAGVADHMVAGPGEEQLRDILIQHNSRRKACGASEDSDLKSYAPNYSQFPLQDYLSPGLILPYSASSGCLWNKCAFCPERAEGNPYVPIPPIKAAGEIKTLCARHRPALVHLLDNTVSPALMKALSEHPPGVPWYGFARADRHLADMDFCLAIKRSGCVMLKLGLESGDQGVLDRMGKGMDLQTASQALRNLKQAGIATYVYLLFGTPWETEREAFKTLEFTAKHSPEITFLNLAVFNMPVNSPEAKEFGTEAFYEGDLSLYTDFRHPAGWDRKAVRNFLENEFRRHTAVAPVVKRTPPVFTSNHAAFIIPGRD